VAVEGRWHVAAVVATHRRWTNLGSGTLLEQFRLRPEGCSKPLLPRILEWNRADARAVVIVCSSLVL
jgi:hypothetical protein